MGTRVIVIFVLGLLVTAVVGAFLAFYLGRGFNLGGEEPYYAVQMENGDLYFGKLSYFPRFGLREVYIVQSVQDPTNPLGGNLRIIPLSQATIWSATEIDLNKDKVLSISEVKKESQVMKLILGQ